jgi:hypothetical protein
MVPAAEEDEEEDREVMDTGAGTKYLNNKLCIVKIVLI